MKKLIALFALVGLMVFTLSFSALGAGQVNFDYIIDGEVFDNDLSGYILGWDYNTDYFKFEIDYILSGELEDLIDYTQMDLKVGYGVTENIFITLSMLDSKLDFSSFFAKIDESLTGYLLGADLSYGLSEQLTFEGSLGISVTGEYKYDDYLEGLGSDSGSSDVDITVLKLKLIYNISDNIGLAFGYNNISIEGEGGGSTDINQMTLGAGYKF